MKRIVVYQSGTGFTAKYAAWIAEALGCDAKEYKNVKTGELTNFDQVIYGGWIMGGMVVGYNKIKALNLKNVVVFAVGMSLPDGEINKRFAEQNQIPAERFFYFEGGYQPDKLNFMKRFMVNTIRKSIEKKENRNEQEMHMLKVVQGGDYTSKESINDLVSYCTV